MSNRARPMAGASRNRFRIPSVVSCSILLLACGSLLAGCAFPGSVKPTIKIGLSAPFEGWYRELGYEVLYAVRLAVRQRNEAGGIGQRFLVELVALNDFGEPAEAVLQAREMNVDSGVLGVVGGWTPEAAGAAGSEYERLGLAFLVPDVDLASPQGMAPPNPDFEAVYEELSGGVPPGPAATWAYMAANRLLDAMEVAAQGGQRPTRAGVRKALTP
jgi:ABC-type branched-subunit amino acid transport system substrate-binding protein